MTEDKTINHVCIDGVYAYLSTGFGIVKVNVKNAEVSETYNLHTPVAYSYIESGYLYAAQRGKGIYRFLGNELYTSNSLGLYDFSARMYDPALGRFLSVDPMAEGYRHLSPYAYCAGNPVVYVDKDGQVIGRVVVGAVVGAAINGGIALLSGESGREVLGAVARGAVDGGIAGLTFGMSMGTTLAGKIAVSAAVGAATSTASSTVGQLVESGGVDEQANFLFSRLAADTRFPCGLKSLGRILY